MRVGDLVTVSPVETGLYLIVGKCPDNEMNWPDADGVVSGMLWSLYRIEEQDVLPMYERWIKVVFSAPASCNRIA